MPSRPSHSALSPSPLACTLVAAVLVVSLPLAFPSAADATEHHFRVVPRPDDLPPRAGEPFQLAILGSWPYYFDEGGPQPRVQVDDDVITVTVRAFYPPILPPTTDFAVEVEVPALAWDIYEVRLQIEGEDSFFDLGELELLWELVKVEPLVTPLLEGEQAEIRVSGFQPCPIENLGPVEVVRDVIRLRISVDCFADSPQTFEVVARTPPLEAGEYRVDVFDAPSEIPVAFSSRTGTARLEVAPRPVLHDGRFALDLEWTDSKGESGPGRPVVQSVGQSDGASASVLYHFFGGDNWELQAKVLDGCEINGRYWVLVGASTDVAWELRIEDLLGGGEWIGSNALGEPSRAITDVAAFPCDVAGVETARSVSVSASASASALPDGVHDDPAHPLDAAAFFPEKPTDRRDLSLWLWSRLPTVYGLSEIRDLEIDEENRRIDIVLLPPFGFLREEALAEIGIDLGRLEAGTWTVAVDQQGGHADELRRIYEREITVAEGYGIVSPLENVGQPVEGVPLDLAVVGPGGRCSDLDLVGVEAPGPDGEAGRIHLAIREPESCNTLAPPGPFRGAVHVGALEAGLYDAVLTRPDLEGRIEFEREIVVLPDPLELGAGRYLVDGRYLGPRYEVDVRWTAFDGLSGAARPAFPPSDDSALFWFFGPENWELMVKVLDGCAINGHVWVFGAASTNVEYTIDVRDTFTGATWTYTNPLGETSPAITDVEAFACPA